MAMKKQLLEASYSCGLSAHNLRVLYEKHKFGGHHKTTAITFDNLRNNTKSLEIRLAKAYSFNEKFQCILDSYEVPIMTLRDFMRHVAEESTEETVDIRQALDALIVMLNETLELIYKIKLSIGDETVAKTKYTRELKDDLTLKVKKYLPFGRSKQSVLDIRNYVLFNTIIILGQTLKVFLNQLS